jgi:hypothetical protein
LTTGPRRLYDPGCDQVSPEDAIGKLKPDFLAVSTDQESYDPASLSRNHAHAGCPRA